MGGVGEDSQIIFLLANFELIFFGILCLLIIKSVRFIYICFTMCVGIYIYNELKICISYLVFCHGVWPHIIDNILMMIATLAPKQILSKTLVKRLLLVNTLNLQVIKG
jgi:hypothetical protein